MNTLELRTVETKGITLGGRVRLVEQRGEQQVFYDALVLGMTMAAELLGTQGEMAIDALIINPLRLLQEDLHAIQGKPADWRDALVRIDDVVHHTHRDWIERRACMAYLEPAPAEPRSAEDEDLKRIAGTA